MIKLLCGCLFIFLLLILPRPWTRVIIRLLLLCLFCSFFCFNRILLNVHALSYGFLMDQMSWALGILTLWLTLLRLIARQKIYQDNKNYSLFIFMLLLLMIFLLFAFFSSRFLLFYFFFERRLIPILFIILLWGYQPERIQAGLYIIIYTLCGSLPLLIRLIIVYVKNGHRRFFLLLDFSFFISYFSYVWVLLLIVAFLVKLPLYGLHLWLPKAHVEAPVAGSMILAGVLLKLGAFGLLRVLEFSPKIGRSWGTFFISFSLIGAVVTRLICLRQFDFKSLIAYSSVAHIGLLVSGVFSYHLWGWQGALMLRVAHGLSSSALFMLANIVYLTCIRRRLYIVKGMQNLFPFVAFWWFIFCIRNMAAPPSLNLLREIILIRRVVATSFVNIIPLALLRFLGAAYSLFLFAASQHGHIRSVLNPLLILSTNFTYVLFLHLVPVVLFILGPIFLGAWC